MPMYLRKNWIHFAIWGGMFLYLVFARDLYNEFVLKNGKPVSVNAELPVRNKKINSYIDLFEPTIYKGEQVYSMVGWSYTTDKRNIPPEDYGRQIVLVSGDRNYIFPTESYPRPDVEKALSSRAANVLNSGFKAKIAPSVIKPGIYRIGLIYHNPNNGKSYYSFSNKYLIRTPNQLKMSDKEPTP